MESRATKVYAKADRKIEIDIIPGHFATNHSHVNYYVNMTKLKTKHSMARAGATVLAGKLSILPVDTIICLEGTEMVGAFLAEEMAQGAMSLNRGVDINVITPEQNVNNQLIFRDNMKGMVVEKNILFLLASVSTGKTIKRTIECLDYYGGRLMGICALFSATTSYYGNTVQSIYTLDDLPDYQTFKPGQCDMCSRKEKIDAIVNSFGFAKI